MQANTGTVSCHHNHLQLRLRKSRPQPTALPRIEYILECLLGCPRTSRCHPHHHSHPMDSNSPSRSRNHHRRRLLPPLRRCIPTWNSVRANGLGESKTTLPVYTSLTRSLGKCSCVFVSRRSKRPKRTCSSASMRSPILLTSELHPIQVSPVPIANYAYLSELCADLLRRDGAEVGIVEDLDDGRTQDGDGGRVERMRLGHDGGCKGEAVRGGCKD